MQAGRHHHVRSARRISDALASSLHLTGSAESPSSSASEREQGGEEARSVDGSPVPTMDMVLHRGRNGPGGGAAVDWP